MSAVFYEGEAQRIAVEATAAAVAEERGRDVRTEIAPLDRFYLAEAYHQKYSLRRRARATKELEAIYPDLDAFVRSTAVTRANAIAAGDLGEDAFRELSPDLGLSSEGLQELGRGVR